MKKGGRKSRGILAITGALGGARPEVRVRGTRNSREHVFERAAK